MSHVINFIVNFGIDFIGSLLAVVVALHFHFEDMWSEHHARVEAKRLAKRIVKLSDQERLALEGKATDGSDSLSEPQPLTPAQLVHEDWYQPVLRYKDDC